MSPGCNESLAAIGCPTLVLKAVSTLQSSIGKNLWSHRTVGEPPVQSPCSEVYIYTPYALITTLVCTYITYICVPILMMFKVCML